MASYEKIIEFVKRCENNNRLWLKEKTFCRLAERAVVHTYEDGLCFCYKTKECDWELYLSISKAEDFKNKEAFALAEKIIIKKPYSYCYITPKTSFIERDFLL